VIVFEVRNGELMGELAKQAAAAGVTAGAIVSLIGAADAFCISTMPTNDATDDVLTDYELPAEMSGTGEFVNGEPHVHVVMAVEGDRAKSGHLHAAYIETHFARAYVIPT
jgi:predicted DNA-binding protein with PD1-like motif